MSYAIHAGRQTQIRRDFWNNWWLDKITPPPEVKPLVVRKPTSVKPWWRVVQEAEAQQKVKPSAFTVLTMQQAVNQATGFIRQFKMTKPLERG